MTAILTIMVRQDGILTPASFLHLRTRGDLRRYVDTAEAFLCPASEYGVGSRIARASHRMAIRLISLMDETGAGTVGELVKMKHGSVPDDRGSRRASSRQADGDGSRSPHSHAARLPENQLSDVLERIGNQIRADL